MNKNAGRMIAGMSLAAMFAGALGGEPVSSARREPEPDIKPLLNKRGQRRGKMPNRSKPIPTNYAMNVRAQRGFTTARLTQLRRDWNKHNRQSLPADMVEWWEWLQQHRDNRPLEARFADITA